MAMYKGDGYDHIRRYLLKEQGFDDDVVRTMKKSELKELWQHYHEEW